MAKANIIVGHIRIDNEINHENMADYLSKYEDGTDGGVSLYGDEGQYVTEWEIDVCDAETICDNIMKAHPDDADGIAFDAMTHIQVVETIQQWIDITKKKPKESGTIAIIWSN